MDVQTDKPSSSAQKTGGGDSSKTEDADVAYKHPFVDFCCGICGLKEKCFYGKLQAPNGRYPQEVYYMRDPFEPPSRKGRKMMLFDFLVLGATCHLCQRSLCLHKSCGIYFGNHFCVDCVSRERRRFPDEVLQIVTKAQDQQVNFASTATDTSTKTT